MGPGRPCIWETVAASRLAPMHPAGFYKILRSGDVTGHRIEKPTHHTSSQRSSKRERESSLLFTTSWEIFKSCHFQGGNTAIGIFVMKIKMKMLTIIITMTIKAMPMMMVTGKHDTGCYLERIYRLSRPPPPVLCRPL